MILPFFIGKNMERILVAVNGTIGSGKDTFSQSFVEADFMRFSFAETLKDAVSVIFGWDRKMLEGDTKESRAVREMTDQYWSDKLGFDISPRWALQNIGTDLFRKHFHDNIWVFSLEKRIRDIKHDRIIITDCRFPNELKMIRELGGTVVEVQRNLPEWYWDAFNYNIKKQCSDTIIDVPESMKGIHSSEYAWVGINKPDFIVENTGTIEYLENQAKIILNSVCKVK